MIFGRLVRRLVVSLVGLAAFFVVANLIVEELAEDRLAAAVQDAFDLPSRPSVDLTAFPVVLRLLDGRIPALSFEAAGVPVDDLRLTSLRVELEGVEADFGIFGTPRGDEVRVERGRAVAEADDPALNAFLERRGIDARVTLREGSVVVRARPVILGRRRTVVGRGKLVLRRGVLSFTPSRVTVDGEPPPRTLEARARREASFRTRLPPLPGGIRVGELEVRPGVARLSASVRGYRLRLGEEDAARPALTRAANRL